MFSLPQNINNYILLTVSSWLVLTIWNLVTHSKCFDQPLQVLKHQRSSQSRNIRNDWLKRLYGLPKYQISKLQWVQNTAARLIMNTRKYDHITPALYSLHWLPVFYRIHFKILIITFKAIYNISPRYICNLMSIKSCSDYSLRSNKSLFLDRPKERSTLGARSFYAAAPTLWNSLPLHIQEITSLRVFKKQLKTYFF